MRNKIYDCFIYYDEDILLDLRFNILSRVVDFFVICESKYDFRGKPKKLNFNYNNFKQFKEKIIYLVVDKFPEKNDAWGNEDYQRNYIINGLEKTSPDDLIILSDVDEIPDPLKILDLEFEKYAIFLQNCFYYKLNLIDKSIGNTWEGSKACRKRNLFSFKKLRNDVRAKNVNYPFWRFDKEKKIKIVKNGGWHFSYLMTAEKIRQKIKSFSHSEFDTEEFTNIKNINNAIETKRDLFNRAHHKNSFEKIELDSSFPEYILKNSEKFKNWIL